MEPEKGAVDRLNEALEGRYRIERELGAGGMATVYLAQDVRHNRGVALKVLRPELAAVVGAERFLAEIETTANLQHPHILPLFDSGEADGLLFYVMPYVEGESLRARLDREHQLPVEDAVRIAADVAEALDYAHRHGVIHRDIKPANLLLQDGRPVIADFGIALALGAAGGHRLTETGLSLGTPHYMSPEQATGDQNVGAATDVYALGCVLHEMLVGEPPFTGSTPQAVLGKIITGAPEPISAQRRSVPQNVEGAIARALEKVPADRFRSAGDFAESLADAGFRHGGAASAASTAPHGPWNRLSVALAVLAVVLGGVLALGRDDSAAEGDAAPLHVALGLAEGESLAGIWAALAPDGSALVYSGLSGEGLRARYRRLDQLDPVSLPGSTWAGSLSAPFFSPDGAWIGFYADNALKRVRVTGGSVETIVHVGTTGVLRPTWTESDTIYFTPSGSGRGVEKVPASGGTSLPVTTVATNESAHWFPDVLPNGRDIVFTLARFGQGLEDGQGTRAVAVWAATEGETRTLVEGASTPRYVAATGHLLYTRPEGFLYSAPFDAERLEITGPERRVLQGVAMNSDSLAMYAVSNAGRLLYVSVAGERRTAERRPVGQRRTEGTLVTVSLAGEERAVDGLDCVCDNPTYSPDGRYLAFGRGALGIWVYDQAIRTLFPITREARYLAPSWRSRNRVSFPRGEGTYWTWLDLRGPPEAVPNDTLIQWQPGAWSPDGRYIVQPATFPEIGEVRLYVIDTGGDGTPRELTSGSIAYAPKISPDGRWLAYQARPTGPDEVYVQPFPEGGAPIQVTQGGGKFPLWAPDMSEIYYRVGSSVHAVEIFTEPSFGYGDSRRLFDGPYSPGGTWAPYDIHPDGGHFVMQKLTASSARLVLVTDFFSLLEEGTEN